MNTYKNTPEADIAGTASLQQTITCSVDQLRQALGEPSYEYRNCWDEDKVQMEWCFTDQDGNVYTIYDWKEYRRFTDDEDIEWHVGGKLRTANGSPLDFVLYVQTELMNAALRA